MRIALLARSRDMLGFPRSGHICDSPQEKGVFMFLREMGLKFENV